MGKIRAKKFLEADYTKCNRFFYFFKKKETEGFF